MAQVRRATPADREFNRLVEAGDGLLGALVREPQSYSLIDVARDDFVFHCQRSVFSVIERMYAQSEAIDGVTVCDRLLRSGDTPPHVETTHQRWQDYIADLIQGAPSAANVEAYAKILRDAGVIRRAKEILTETSDIFDQAALENMVARLMQLSVVRTQGGRRLADDIPAFIDSLDQLQSGVRPGLTTGLPQLDKFLGGWIPSDLYLVAARSSMGKTAAMINFSRSLLDVPQGIISAEQPARQLLQRYCALIGEVDAQNVRLGQLDQEGWERVDDALSVVAKAPIFIDDRSSTTITEVAKVARRWKYKHKIKILWVDYAQRIRANTRDNRAAEVGEVARGLKDIARELDIPVVALAQLNREADKRTGGRPALADLRESGDLEQEADSVIMIYRPSVYDVNIEDKRLTELIITKNRHGPLGFTKVEFFHEFMKYAPYPDYPREEDFLRDGK